MNFIFEVNIIKLLAALDLSRIIPTTGADAARNEDMGLVNVSFIRRLINPKMWHALNSNSISAKYCWYVGRG